MILNQLSNSAAAADGNRAAVIVDAIFSRAVAAAERHAVGRCMGYDLHITRKEFWSDDQGPIITLEEWSAYVASDPAIQLDRDNLGVENYVVSSATESWPLWWDPAGELFTKNPDSGAIAKLVEIARALHARVLGDDEEIYGVDPADPTICERR